LAALESAPLSPDDLSFWYADQPRQRTTMALLMLLDRKPDPERQARPRDGRGGSPLRQ
jgi:hypothetical protein